jgi:hypothetical protein
LIFWAARLNHATRNLAQIANDEIRAARPLPAVAARVHAARLRARAAATCSGSAGVHTGTTDFDQPALASTLVFSSTRKQRHQRSEEKDGSHVST